MTNERRRALRVAVSADETLVHNEFIHINKELGLGVSGGAHHARRL
jgi:hypothetical protein